MGDSRKRTVRDIRAMPGEGRTVVAVTAYDATFGRLMDEAGVDLILVGDSMGNVMLGHPNTLRVTLAESLSATAAVVRGVKHALVVGDMPFMSYHCGEDEAVRNAGRYLQEAGADAIKLEGGHEVVPLVKRLVTTGIPVLAHIGLMPQKIAADGSYRIRGRSDEEAERLLSEAQAIEEAGAFAIVLEGVVMDVSKQLSEALDIPTIGIGAGPHCDGQIQVMHDILGLFEEFVPKHTKRYAQLADDVRKAIGNYSRDVRGGDFPMEDNSFS